MRRKALNPTAPARSGPTASAREDRRVLASLEATGPARAAQGQTAQAWPTHSALAKLRPRRTGPTQLPPRERDDRR